MIIHCDGAARGNPGPAGLGVHISDDRPSLGIPGHRPYAQRAVRLLVAEPAKIAINGPGQQALACGVQKARRVVVLLVPKSDARLGTSGEVASIEFQ